MPATTRTNVDVSGFLKRFSRFGRQPTVEGYVDLFEPNGTVQHPGMPRPLSGEQIQKFISAVLALMPDFRLQPVAWCSHGDIVFVEAMTSGSVREAHATWPAIYCVKLNGDRVVTGRSYYDRAGVFSQLQGERPSQFEERVPGASVGAPKAGDGGDIEKVIEEFVRPYVEAWRAPEKHRILDFYTQTGSILIPAGERVPREDVVPTRVEIADVGTLRQHCEAYAVCTHDVFFHWRITGSLDGRPFEVGAAERVTLDGLKIADGAMYFDRISIEAVRDPSLASRTIFDAAK
jgi:hypothetical protein